MIYACMWHRVVDAPEGLPPQTVFLDCRPTAGDHRSVVPDDRAGGAAAVRELVAAGHRRIAYLDTDDDPIASDLRHDGYREALTEAGIEVDDTLHVTAETSARGGRAGAEALLDL